MAQVSTAQPRHIVIVGGGVIGATTAYFLTRHPKYDRAQVRVTVLEASSVAAGASGKAGGLLGLWAYPQELVPLSYRLHKELADEHGGAQRWGYRNVGCGHIRAEVTQEVLDERRAHVQDHVTDTKTEGDAPSTSTRPEPDQKEWEKLPKQDDRAARLLSPTVLPADLDWVDARVVETYDRMGVPGAYDTAQVHPLHFTTSMADLASERGVDIRLGAQVTGIAAQEGTQLHTVTYLDRSDDSTHTIRDIADVVVAAGPWTGVVLPRTYIEGLRAHSVVWHADVSPYAVFTDVGLPSTFVPEHRRAAGQTRRRHRGRVDPEIYARPFGEVYACGEPDSAVPLPATADRVTCDAAQCDDIVAYVSTFSPVLATADIKARQACYLPRHMRFGVERGPLLGQTATRGLWVASGHTCWGIQNAPATGCVMAEMLLDGHATSANVAKFDPTKFKV